MTSIKSNKGKRPLWLKTLFVTGALALGSASSHAIITDLSLVGTLHEAIADAEGFRLDQTDLNSIADQKVRFDKAFLFGDEYFEFTHNVLGGAGANVGDGSRFTRVPRADLKGPGQWADHKPMRSTGPNGQGCVECHNRPFGTQAGSSALAAHRDPLHTGKISQMIRRDTPHLGGSGALQLLAEEMTEQLHRQRKRAARKACKTGKPVTAFLKAKGVSFGSVRMDPHGWGKKCTTEQQNWHLEGVDEDLVVKPYQWKGSDATLRGFNRGALHNELGIQATELIVDEDGDGDGVINEATVGDVTGLVAYVAGQPRPTTRLEMGDLVPAVDGYPKLTKEEKAQIRMGNRVFRGAGCATCHKPAMVLRDPVFKEPSDNKYYRDATFPSGLDPASQGLLVSNQLMFDLTKDLDDNDMATPLNSTTLGNFETNAKGHAIVRLYGDLKRHDMGYGLAESIDEVGTGKANFLTKELWGVGSTEPYLHDGRATTLTEAILEHGGEAKASREAFKALPLVKQEALIAFLNNLILFKAAEE